MGCALRVDRSRQKKWRSPEQRCSSARRNSDGDLAEVITRREDRETRDVARKNRAVKHSPEEQCARRLVGLRESDPGARPPAAKYSSATQPNIANARLPEMSLAKSISLMPHTSV